MFDKFGEFDSVKELNEAAEGLLKEGDEKSLFELAEENGIEKEDAEDYIDGCTDTLASISLAAYGRLNVEQAAAVTKKGEEMIAKVLFTMVRGMCKEESFAMAVVSKGKRVMNIYKIMRDEAKEKKSNCVVACGTDKELRNIINTYYMQGDEAVREVIKKLY